MKSFTVVAVIGSGLFASIASAATFNTLTGAAPVIIGHRGATGYLPEHTLAGYELAIKLGADYIEPDLQTTADGQLVCMHDATLDRTTDVAGLFAKRNGHSTYEVSDFTLAEIKTLTVHADTSANPIAGNTYPGFTPTYTTADQELKVPAFTDVLTFVKAERAAGHDIGVYPEAKQGDSVQEADIIADLTAAGLTKASDKVVVQSFDSGILKDLHTKEASLGWSIPLMQLDSSPTAGELAADAKYAQIVGPNVSSANVNASYIAAAHAAGLAVHGYTFTDPNEATAVPAYEKYFGYGIDGVFSNYADLALEARNAMVPEPASVGVVVGIATIALRRTRRAVV